MLRVGCLSFNGLLAHAPLEGLTDTILLHLMLGVVVAEGGVLRALGKVIYLTELSLILDVPTEGRGCNLASIRPALLYVRILLRLYCVVLTLYHVRLGHLLGPLYLLLPFYRDNVYKVL